MSKEPQEKKNLLVSLKSMGRGGYDTLSTPVNLPLRSMTTSRGQEATDDNDDETAVDDESKINKFEEDKIRNSIGAIFISSNPVFHSSIKLSLILQ